MEEGIYRWEGGYEKTWESLVEDDDGSLDGAVLTLIHKAKRRRLEERQKNQRLGIMRHVMLILDMSKPMASKDFPPSRLDVALKSMDLGRFLQTVGEFVDQFFDQNPIGQLGLIVTKDRIATKLADLSGNPKKIRDALRRLEEERCVGELSLQNALHVALDSLKHIPTHSSRETICLLSSLTTCDPGNVISTIQVLKDSAIKCSVIGMSAEVRVFRRLTQETGGRHDVMLDESHLRDLFLSHALPPPCPKEMESNLITMGFPVHRIYREGSEASGEFGSMLSMCACHPSSESGTKRFFTRSGYFCPKCGSKYCEIPVECVSCGITLVTAPHLARSYHHLFPLPPFTQTNVDMNIRSECAACRKKLEQKAYKCTTCEGLFCVDCDCFIHDTLHTCPSCILQNQSSV